MEEYGYEIDCEICNNESVVILSNENESPSCCPMCGSDAIEVVEIEVD